MRHSVDPRQKWLFDPGLSMFSDVARRRLMEDWPGLFRTCLLELMPTERVGAHFDQIMGCPTKELYSVCGLLLLMEFNDWTVEQAADAYMFDGRIQFALNLGRDCQSMSTRTIERYQRIFRKEQLSKDVMDRVTRHLVELLELEVDKLRLDSTHVFSNMASFGRTRLMMITTRRFLVQLKRHDSNLYYGLAADLRTRYEKKNWEFGRGNKGCPSRDEMANDMHWLIARFESVDRVSNRTSYQDLCRVFSEQCEVVEGKITIRKKTGGNVVQNPSDPDATFDGKKGQGYQVQTAETCSDENEIQLIVSAIPQTACEHDQNAVETVLNDLADNKMVVSDIVADAGYGGDRNYLTCQGQGINLIAPVIQGNQTEGRIELTEFHVGCDNCIQSCPAGFAPLRAWFNLEEDHGAATFAREHCEQCPLQKRCQASRNGTNYYVYMTGRALRASQRKLALRSPIQAHMYAMRSGIEATYSMAKTSHGMRRLRVRGQSSVFHAILGRITGINIIRAAKSLKIRKLIKERLVDSARSALADHWNRFLSAFNRHHQGRLGLEIMHWTIRPSLTA